MISQAISRPTVLKHPMVAEGKILLNAGEVRLERTVPVSGVHGILPL